MKMLSYILIGCFLTSCSSLKKDNEPKTPSELSEGVQARVSVYRPLLKAQADKHGLMVMGGSIGDSALFSCLARVGGATDFDPAILIPGGKPLRHPDIKPSDVPNAKGGLGTPISKDMVDGIQWCLWDVGRKGDLEHARILAESMIAFGKAHAAGPAGWLFCTEEDRVAYKISAEDWAGRCLMTPATIKDLYRIAKWAGSPCDSDCQAWMAVGVNVPSDAKGFARHLAVITTVRNGLVEHGINDNSLKTVLQNAATAQPRNALFVAAYHLFGDGDAEPAYAALNDPALFPADALPGPLNYCTEYLFQRDDDSADATKASPDWAPCTGDFPAGARGRGIDYLFAAGLALGEVR